MATKLHYNSSSRPAESIVIAGRRRRRRLEAGFRVLIVEHRDEVFALLATDLACVGAKIARATSAADATAQLQPKSPDLVIANRDLPDESGWLMVSKWRLSQRHRSVWFYADWPEAFDANWVSFTKVERLIYCGDGLLNSTDAIGQQLRDIIL